MDFTALSRDGWRIKTSLCARRNRDDRRGIFSLVAGRCRAGGTGIDRQRPGRRPPTSTPAPTATPTPIPISATQAGTGAALQDFKTSGNTVWTSNEVWLIRLLKQFAATPELLRTSKTSTAAALVARRVDRALLQIAGADFVDTPDDAGLPPVYSPKIRAKFSTLALDLHNFETNGVYGDTKDELPPGEFHFTSNPKGARTPATDTLTIRFNDPTLGSNLVTFFDWTGASTGKSSPTVQAHDPLNPGAFIELPTRVVWEIQDKGTTILNAVIDVQWLPSPCASGKFLFDIPVSADATGFIAGADLVTRFCPEPVHSPCPARRAPRPAISRAWAAANQSSPAPAHRSPAP